MKTPESRIDMSNLQEVLLVNPNGSKPAPLPAAPMPAQPNPQPNPQTPVENPDWKEWIQGVTPAAFLGGTFGVITAAIIPRFVKFTSGWKNVLAVAAVGIGGAWLVSKFSKQAAVGWVIAVGAAVILKLINNLLGKKFQSVLGEDDELFGEDDELFGEDDELFGDGMGAEIFEESDIFGADRVIPTATQ